MSVKDVETESSLATARTNSIRCALKNWSRHITEHSVIMQHQPRAIVHVQLIRYDRMTDFTAFSIIFVTASQISQTNKSCPLL